MRERRSSDWVIDLQGRHGIEAHVEHAIARHPTLTLLTASTSSLDRLDFQLLSPDERLLELEVKAKHQPLSRGWQDLRPDVDETDLFVLDELALRKIIDAGRYAFLLVRDIPRARWVVWSLGELLVASRVRHARRLERGPVVAEKGKLLLDLREGGARVHDVDVALDWIAETSSRIDRLWQAVAPWPRAEVGG